MRLAGTIFSNVTKMLDFYSQFNPSPLSIKQFIDFGKLLAAYNILFWVIQSLLAIWLDGIRTKVGVPTAYLLFLTHDKDTDTRLRVRREASVNCSFTFRT